MCLIMITSFEYSAAIRKVAQFAIVSVLFLQIAAIACYECECTIIRYVAFSAPQAANVHCAATGTQNCPG